mgnify:CR=1 FL=1
MTIPTKFTGVLAYVSADAPPTYDAAGFVDASVTYTLLSEVINFPEMGRVYTDIAYNTLAVRGTQHSKGTYDESEVAIELGAVRLDAGQIILKTARDSDANYTYKFVHPNGEIDAFQALMTGLVNAGGDGNTTRAVTATVRIDHRGSIEIPA